MTEEWRDIKGYEGLYQVSNLGRVKSLRGWNGHKIIDCEKILNPTKQMCGNNYMRYIVRLQGRNYKVHRLVAEAFIPNPNNYTIINHKDNNALNNQVDNLEWCTQAQNVAHSIKNQRYKNRPYFDKQKAIELYKQGFTAKEIATVMRVNLCSIRNLLAKSKINRKKYPRKSKYGVTVEQLKMLFESGVTNKEISILFNIPDYYIARRKYQIKIGEI